MTTAALPTVLIVEDDEPIGQYVAFVVADAGCHPVLATHGLQALELAQVQWPALVIADLMLPFLSGAELIVALRAEAVLRRVRLPVILMTSAGLPQARAAGADAILRKPFTLADLQALLHRFLVAGAQRQEGD